MRAFSHLLERLILTPQRNGKLKLLQDYFAATPDPERGFALAVLTGELSLPSARPAMLRELIQARMDPVLFALSYDYVGDLAETISLAWPERSSPDRPNSELHLSDIIAALLQSSRRETPALVEGWLDRSDSSVRYALLKLLTGGLRVGVSARLAKTALAQLGTRSADEIEEIWHGLEPPYEALFAWVEGRGPVPINDNPAPFRPAMLAHPIQPEDFEKLVAGDFSAEFKWDGIRVQASAGYAPGGILKKALYSRTGEDIARAFPDLVDVLSTDMTIDGELLVLIDGRVQPFNVLQQRLNRKTVSAKMMSAYPAHIRAYDLLVRDGEDLRPLPFAERRRHLEQVVTDLDSARIDISPLIAMKSWDEAAAARANPADFGSGADADAVEGLMLKRWDSSYVPGRPRGPWFKWKRDPYNVDAVLMYAQRGHGKRSSFYSDYTFGVWRESELVPVGKAYFGFTDEELKEIDRFVRANTINRFGPVREVTHTLEKGLVLEVAFEGLNRSTRHKSGVAMRFPRIARLRWDKPPAEADRIESLEALLPREDTV
uniref:cisplatin damage response ATP-dependent DNA ligase n=1 Tax=Pararhizobium sp. IMCC3301 TaxID=3067904 RepID=UPI002740617F|nr:cisplatin damage response ATP-dependent DNA ligase [Pararhizobium sp. IMCC3301]